MAAILFFTSHAIPKHWHAWANKLGYTKYKIVNPNPDPVGLILRYKNCYPEVTFVLALEGFPSFEEAKVTRIDNPDVYGYRLVYQIIRVSPQSSPRGGRDLSGSSPRGGRDLSGSAPSRN